jgi:hypothetical protein
MKGIVMSKFKGQIETTDDVVKYFIYLIEELHLNFHPDTDFSEYISFDTGVQTFNDKEIHYHNSLMDRCFSVCEESGVDIYDIGMKVLKGKLMNEEQAERIADILGGSTWQSGGNIWLVLFERNDGKLVVLSDEVVCEYDNQEALDESKPMTTILLH